jgi:hypothetical protein
MAIEELYILPPLAIARFGSSETPLEAFELEESEAEPLAFRKIVPKETLEVDRESGAISRSYVPSRIRFKDGDSIRPVAPFLEVFARIAATPDVLEPLTLDLLSSEGIRPEAVNWSIRVANLKVFRQTGNPDDKVTASIQSFSDHKIYELKGQSANFLDGKFISFGNVRYIRPTTKFPEIRLRFTPAQGKVYGASPVRLVEGQEVIDPVFVGYEERIVYNKDRGTWYGFQADANSPVIPNPSDIYHGYWPSDQALPTSWGYLDDVCDGQVSLSLTLKNGKSLEAHSWISACMPDFAPDCDPIRTVADELEQLILGPSVDSQDVSIHNAARIVLRSLETIRLMNTMVMNGNVIDGRANIAATLGRQDTNDYKRYYAPIMAASLTDNLAVRALHERIFSALQSGSAPWFAEVLRRPEEVGDLSDKGRRKMPPMLRGADGRALALTRRQIDMIVKAAIKGLYDS